MSRKAIVLASILACGLAFNACDNSFIPDRSMPYTSTNQPQNYEQFLPTAFELGDNWIEVDRACASVSWTQPGLYKSTGESPMVLLPSNTDNVLDYRNGPSGVARAAYYFQGLEHPVSLMVTALANCPAIYPLKNINQLPTPSAHLSAWRLGVGGVASALPDGKLPGSAKNNPYVLQTPYAMYLASGGILYELRGSEELGHTRFQLAADAIRKRLETQLINISAGTVRENRYRLPTDRFWGILNRLTPPGH